MSKRKRARLIATCDLRRSERCRLCGASRGRSSSLVQTCWGWHLDVLGLALQVLGVTCNALGKRLFVSRHDSDWDHLHDSDQWSRGCSRHTQSRQLLPKHLQLRETHSMFWAIPLLRRVRFSQHAHEQLRHDEQSFWDHVDDGTATAFVGACEQFTRCSRRRAHTRQSIGYADGRCTRELDVDRGVIRISVRGFACMAKN